jgi:hypothetical protein
MIKMTRDPNRDTDAWLDQMLDEVGRSPVPDPSADLMARVLEDAHALMPTPVGRMARTPLWQQIVDGLGGWSAVGGLVAAGVAGLAIGLGAVDATGVDALWPLGGFDGYDSQAGLSAFGWDFEEG